MLAQNLNTLIYSCNDKAQVQYLIIAGPFTDADI